MEELSPFAIVGAVLRFLWALFFQPGILKDAVCWLFFTPPPASPAYEARKAFLEDAKSAGAPRSWLADAVVTRAIRLAEEETGLAPERSNAAAQALMRYAILGRKVARGTELTDDERRIVENLTAAPD